MTTLESETQLVDRLDEIGSKIQDVRDATGTVIFGQERVVDLSLLALLCGGHGLLIGVPGLGKTRLVETLGAVLGLEAKRVQFTPDLMPADILGSEVLEDRRRWQARVQVHQGPVFCQLLMADEINRASPGPSRRCCRRCRNHGHHGGSSRTLPRPFHVLATQNPIEQEGTYPLARGPA